jgi:hypothetical protein
MSRNFNPEERAKLKNLIKEAIGIHMEVETLSGGLKDTVKAIAEEMQIKPGVLNRAIKMSDSKNVYQAREDMDIVESILNATDNLFKGEEE